MKQLPGRCLLALSLLSALCASGVWAQGQVNIYLDFDNDGDPWTLRTSLPAGETTGTAKFILEVVSLPLPADQFNGFVEEGCCNYPEFDGHYGTYVDALSVTFDPAYLSEYTLGFPTCTYCCPWMLTARLNPSAPVVAGQRCFIGQGVWNAHCELQPCTPPTDFDLSFDTIGGGGHMVFTCPPTPDDPPSWGKIKFLYR